MKLTHYWQIDPRWKYIPLGFGKQGQTIGSHGCLLCAEASVFEWMTGQEMPPDQLNKELQALRAFDGAYMDTHAVTKMSSKITSVDYIPCKDYPAPLEDIDMFLASGIPVIVWIDRSDDAGIQDHWVTIIEKKGDDYLVNDPIWPAADNPRSMVKEYSHLEPKHLILGILTLQSQLVPLTPPAIPMDGDYLEVLEDRLNIRNKPNTDDRYDIGDLWAGQTLEYAGETIEDQGITWAKVNCYVALRQGDYEYARVINS